MDKQFVFLNFHTEYSSKGTVNKPMRREYCFSTIFYDQAEQDNSYRIRFYKELNGVNDGAKNNACFLTKDELFDFISIAKRIHDFDLKIEDENDMFVVCIKLNAPRIVHRYILSWVRYAYEFPFNMYLADAIRLKNTMGFRREDIFNLYNLVSASSGYYWHGDSIHAIGNSNDIRPFFSVEEQIKRVNEYNATGEINYIFPTINIKEFNRMTSLIDNYENKIECLDFWNDKKEFKNRLAIYRKNRDLIKKHKVK